MKVRGAKRLRDWVGVVVKLWLLLLKLAAKVNCHSNAASPAMQRPICDGEPRERAGHNVSIIRIINYLSTQITIEYSGTHRNAVG